MLETQIFALGKFGPTLANSVVGRFYPDDGKRPRHRPNEGVWGQENVSRPRF
ncbi:MAG: hypothetical protein FWC43_10305 [Planctomycetaceae bacterium]|nr:hypothetical protein [Planctomycetaceae bacterium]